MTGIARKEVGKVKRIEHLPYTHLYCITSMAKKQIKN